MTHARPCSPSRFFRRVAALFLALFAIACASDPPSNPSNACAIFSEKRGWWDAVRDSERRWGVPPHVQLAIIHQESAFEADARPDRRKFLFIFPGPRPSSAYGYAQAIDATWAQYQESTGRRNADRDRFRSAADFVGWYGAQSRRRSGIALDDTYRQYLAYHEGHGGYNRGSYRNNRQLKRVARNVSAQARRYERQLRGCEDDLGRFLFFF